MSTSTKQQELHAMSAEEQSLPKDSLSEKHQDYLQEQDNHPTSPYLSLHVSNVDTSTTSSYQSRSRTWNSLYWGLQGQIYD